MNVQGKVALVTGGASGMGAATAAYLTEQGMKVAILDRAINNVDVTDEAAVSKTIDEVVAQHGAIHVLVNCAGIATGARVVGRDGPQPLAEFSRVINVNLIGTFNVLRLVAAQMTQQDTINDDGERGVMINTASVAAFDGQLGQAAYSASKGGVVAMTLPIARELSRFGIRVMTIAPGIMQTPMMAGMSDAVQQSLHEQIPFPKRLGDPDEYAKLVLQIIENTYLNGTVIRLDAGIRMAAR